jgi:hypothetical protein
MCVRVQVTVTFKPSPNVAWGSDVLKGQCDFRIGLQQSVAEGSARHSILLVVRAITPGGRLAKDGRVAKDAEVRACVRVCVCVCVRACVRMRVWAHAGAVSQIVKIDGVEYNRSRLPIIHQMMRKANSLTFWTPYPELPDGVAKRDVVVGAGGGMGGGQHDRYTGFGALVAAAATARTPETTRGGDGGGGGGGGAGGDGGEVGVGASGGGDAGGEGVHAMGGGRPGFGSDDLASERSRRSSGGFTHKLGQLFYGSRK